MIDSNAVRALNLYSRARAQQFAVQAAGAVALARCLEEREQLAGHVEKVLTSRSVIDQALGVIIARTGHDAEHAFKLLRTVPNTRTRSFATSPHRSSNRPPAGGLDDVDALI